MDLLWIMMGVVGVAIAAATYRALRGPSLPDRVLAMDLIVICLMGVFALLAVIYDLIVLIDLVVVLALVAFISTVGFCWFIQRDDPDGAKRAEQQPEERS